MLKFIALFLCFTAKLAACGVFREVPRSDRLWHLYRDTTAEVVNMAQGEFEYSVILYSSKFQQEESAIM